jgi:hypothetical protein
MIHTDGVIWPSSNIETDLSQLTNVFRVLSKTEDERREKAIRLREEISSKWAYLASKGDWFPWPTTMASAGVHRLKGIDWPPHGMLSSLGYHVGETQPTPRKVRWRILEYVFECHLPPLNGPVYYSDWGVAQSARRLNKMADTLAALTRNAKRRDARMLEKAIDDWEVDLAFLHERYYFELFHFGWPATDYLH